MEKSKNLSKSRDTNTPGRGVRVTLRSSYRTISSNDEIIALFKQKGFFDSVDNPSGMFRNDYILRTISGDPVVTDRAAGLMWHPSGNDDRVTFSAAKSWVRDLNLRRYAGYSDWRLPTLEEAASLLESSKMNGNLHIAPVFSRIQEFIWTGDKYDAGNGWIVQFYNLKFECRPYKGESFFNQCFVRPVRSDKIVHKPKTTRQKLIDKIMWTLIILFFGSTLIILVYIFIQMAKL